MSIIVHLESPKWASSFPIVYHPVDLSPLFRRMFGGDSRQGPVWL